MTARLSARFGSLGFMTTSPGSSGVRPHVCSGSLGLWTTSPGSLGLRLWLGLGLAAVAVSYKFRDISNIDSTVFCADLIDSDLCDFYHS